MENKIGKTALYIGVGWLVVIISMILYNVLPILTGTEVLLEIKPIDPRDLLRGDYVTLKYAVSQVYMRDKIGKDVIVVLKTDENNVAQIDYIEDFSSNVKGKLYLRGKVRKNGIKYGIESYFVKEKTGREIERKINSSSKSYARVKIASNGKAKVTGLELNKEFNK